MFRYLIITFIPRVSVSDTEPDILFFSILNYIENKHNQEINSTRLSYYFIVSQLFFLITFTQLVHNWKWFANETNIIGTHMSHNNLIVCLQHHICNINNRKCYNWIIFSNILLVFWYVHKRRQYIVLECKKLDIYQMTFWNYLYKWHNYVCIIIHHFNWHNIFVIA